MSPLAPDLAGYRAALLRKRDALGSEVTFHFATEATWPDGTVLDPNTGRPYDPMIAPASEDGAPAVTMTLSVAFRPNFQEDTQESKVGDVKMNVTLAWMTIEEWAALGDPTSYDYAGDNYLIRKATEEGIGGEPWRMLIWGERQLGEGQVS
jgi:hypothetical protein